MNFFDSISSITNSYSKVPNLNNGLDGTVRHAEVKLGETPVDTVTLSENQRSLAKAKELKTTHPEIYKKLKKQVITKKPALNGNRNKCADAIMVALRKNSEYKELAAQIDAKFDPPKVQTPSKSEIARQEQVKKEREVSKKALEKKKAKDAFKKSPEGQATKRLDQIVMNANQDINRANQDINRATKEVIKQNPQAESSIKEIAVKAKQEIATSREAIKNPVGAVEQLQETAGKIVSGAKSHIDETKSAAQVAEKTGKGFWNWLTKTTKGKWTAAGATAVAIGAGIYAYLSGDKNTESGRSLDKAA